MLADIKTDYFSSLTENVFRKEHLGNTSLVMKIAGYRFANEDTMRLLKARIEPIAEKLYAGTDLMLHPIFYLRIGYPGNYYSDSYRYAFLDSQPHYDRAFGVDAYSFWVALENIDDESGGLAEFSSPETDAHFTLNDGRNRYNYDSYLEESGKIDAMLKSSCRAPHANAGDVLTFDSSVLHGATKPISRKRISFDFRLAPRRAVEGASDEVQAIDFAGAPESSTKRRLKKAKETNDDDDDTRRREFLESKENHEKPLHRSGMRPKIQEGAIEKGNKLP